MEHRHTCRQNTLKSKRCLRNSIIFFPRVSFSWSRTNFFSHCSLAISILLAVCAFHWSSHSLICLDLWIFFHRILGGRSTIVSPIHPSFSNNHAVWIIPGDTGFRKFHFSTFLSLWELSTYSGKSLKPFPRERKKISRPQGPEKGCGVIIYLPSAHDAWF